MLALNLEKHAGMVFVCILVKIQFHKNLITTICIAKMPCAVLCRKKKEVTLPSNLESKKLSLIDYLY